MKKIIKKLKLEKLFKIYWVFLKMKSLLIIQNKSNTCVKKYILFPVKTILNKHNSVYFLMYEKLIFFYTYISKWIESFYKPVQKKLFFKGLGFKFKYANKKKTKLELKIGFSHFFTIIIPVKQVSIFLIKKNRLSIEGLNRGFVGNLAEKIKNLRFPDSYNGKGFWYKNEFKNLKQIKKT